MKKLIALAKKLYAIRWVDRGIWTVAEIAVGLVAAKVGGKAYFGISAASVVFAVKEFVASKLAASGETAAVPQA